VTVREAAAELGVSQQMIHKLKAQRQLAYVKVGSRIVILDESVADFKARSIRPVAGSLSPKMRSNISSPEER
jgi:excisionase family DNA binding protein